MEYQQVPQWKEEGHDFFSKKCPKIPPKYLTLPKSIQKHQQSTPKNPKLSTNKCPKKTRSIKKYQEVPRSSGKFSENYWKISRPLAEH